MTDARDALAALIAENEDDPPEWGGSPQEWGERLADAIIGAGWKSPAEYAAAEQAGYDRAERERAEWENDDG